MSKIYKISGNFTQNDKWVCQDCSFEGEIVVAGDKTFYGYCNEVFLKQKSGKDVVKSIAGVFGPSGKSGKEGISFYKITKERASSTLMYAVPELGYGKCGTWGIYRKGQYKPLGQAKVDIEEEVFTLARETRIKNIFDRAYKKLPIAANS